MKRHDREAHIADLLRQIQQQRQDLSTDRQAWLAATARYDRGWQTLLRAKHFLLPAGGVFVVLSLRHPRRLIRWGKRGLGLWSSWRVVRNALPRITR